LDGVQRPPQITEPHLPNTFATHGQSEFIFGVQPSQLFGGQNVRRGPAIAAASTHTFFGLEQQHHLTAYR
jgi:hypothetical protein